MRTGGQEEITGNLHLQRYMFMGCRGKLLVRRNKYHYRLAYLYLLIDLTQELIGFPYSKAIYPLLVVSRNHTTGKGYFFHSCWKQGARSLIHSHWFSPCSKMLNLVNVINETVSFELVFI